MNLPDSLEQARQHLLNQIAAIWDVDENDPTHLWQSPLGQLVAAFGECRKGNEAYWRLVWLTMFVARRALPCWEQECDSRQPRESVEAVRDLLLTGRLIAEVEKFSEPAVPKRRGFLITDCRYCDTSCAADAAAFCVQFADKADPIKAVVSLCGADMAFDQSSGSEKFREWLIDYAVPIAYEQREMTTDEQDAC